MEQEGHQLKIKLDFPPKIYSKKEILSGLQIHRMNFMT